MSLLDQLRRMFHRAPRVPASVRFDDERVEHRRSDGTLESIRWNDLAEVDIVTTDGGPAVDDVYWVLSDASNSTGCAIGSETPGMRNLLPKLQALPGFDHGALIRAMGSASDAKFICWKRDAETPGAILLTLDGVLR